MIIDKYIERIDRLDRLIRLQATGTPKQLAARMRISQRKLYETLNIMRVLGAPIKYDRINSTYTYTHSVRFYAGFYEQEVRLTSKPETNP